MHDDTIFRMPGIAEPCWISMHLSNLNITAVINGKLSKHCDRIKGFIKHILFPLHPNVSLLIQIVICGMAVWPYSEIQTQDERAFSSSYALHANHFSTLSRLALEDVIKRFLLIFEQFKISRDEIKFSTFKSFPFSISLSPFFFLLLLISTSWLFACCGTSGFHFIIRKNAFRNSSTLPHKNIILTFMKNCKRNSTRTAHEVACRSCCSRSDS